MINSVVQEGIHHGVDVMSSCMGDTDLVIYLTPNRRFYTYTESSSKQTSTQPNPTQDLHNWWWNQILASDSANSYQAKGYGCNHEIQFTAVWELQIQPPFFPRRQTYFLLALKKKISPEINQFFIAFTAIYILIRSWKQEPVRSGERARQKRGGWVAKPPAFHHRAASPLIMRH